MLVEVLKEEYRRHFTTDPHMFISETFIGMVQNKCDRMVRLMKEDDSSMGLIAGIKDDILKSPFSAPFGGFHYSHEHQFYYTISNFITDLKEYVNKKDLKGVSVTLPPDLYQANMNAKLINAFIRSGFTMAVPDICNWADLKNFDGKWAKYVVEQNCRKAVKHGLTWSLVTDMKSKEDAYEVIFRNREEQGRKIYMTLDDLLEMEHIVPVDFFLVRDSNGNGIGAGIFYRGHEKIVTGIFMGDDMEKRNLGIMNLMYKHCFYHYKDMGFDYIDLGTSSFEGEPNIGLIRFKELHNCITSLRYTFSWAP
ncbi:MAG: hypothetical protein VB074_02255 [Proteiniphilum sp.]|jgi:hypothetical protein|uniref:hypothetical protein n=1 Tax=Proteiniphilum sp. TaxID=1926877 RepID=UPI00092624B3|nr:hypothetical protein [Proteiniphilum sp.]MEA5126983.1 hypothetical protein [Proteiniphilum sp.]OJV81851.1 MAG: hypothetical protein BGO34_08740 [Bacteroidia bacterium 44-10]